MFREYDPSIANDPMGTSVSYGETNFTVESIIRRYLDAEAQVAVQALAVKNDERKMKMVAEMLRRHDKSKAEGFRAMFNPATAPHAEKGGLALFEPYAAGPAETPVSIDGSVFPAQGSRTAKRMWIVAEGDDGSVAPVRFVGITDGTTGMKMSKRARRRYRPQQQMIGSPLLPPPSPWGDMRLLAGNMVVGSSDAFTILAGISNMLQSVVQVISWPVADGAPFVVNVPTLLTPTSLMRIAEVLGDGVPMSMFPMLGDRVVDIIEGEILRNQGIATSLHTIQPLLNTARLDFDQINTGALPHTGYSDMQKKSLLQEHRRLDAEVRALIKDPILYIKGPTLGDRQDREVVLADTPGIRLAGNNIDRRRTLPGFLPGNVRHFGYGLPDNADTLYTAGDPIRKFTDTPSLATPESALLSSINTLYNLLLNKDAGMVVRLSSWRAAMGGTASTRVVEVPEDVGVDDIDTVMPLGMRPWYSQVAMPDAQRQFRLHLANPPSATPGLDDATIGALGAQELQYDADFKAFELDLRIGNTRDYVNEVLTTIRIMLQMLLTPLTDAVPGIMADDEGGDGKTTGLIDTLYGPAANVNHLYNKFVPVFGVPSFGGLHDVIERVDKGWGTNLLRNHLRLSVSPVKARVPFPFVFKTKDGAMSVSACSQFMYRHAAIQSTSPFRRGAAASHRELSVFIASLNPFPVTSPVTREFLDNVTREIRPFMCAEFKKGLHFVSVRQDHGDTYRHNQIVGPDYPASPPNKMIHFQRTTSNKDGRFRWCCGSESTPTLEAAVGVVHLINAIVAAAESNGTVTLDNTPPPPDDDDNGGDDGGGGGGIGGLPQNLDLDVDDVATKREALRTAGGTAARRLGQQGVFTPRSSSEMEVNARDYARWLGLTSARQYNQAGAVRFGGTDGGLVQGTGSGLVGCFAVTDQSKIERLVAGATVADRIRTIGSGLILNDDGEVRASQPRAGGQREWQRQDIEEERREQQASTNARSVSPPEPDPELFDEYGNAIFFESSDDGNEVAGDALLFSADDDDDDDAPLVQGLPGRASVYGGSIPSSRAASSSMIRGERDESESESDDDDGNSSVSESGSNTPSTPETVLDGSSYASSRSDTAAAGESIAVVHPETFAPASSTVPPAEARFHALTSRKSVSDDTFNDAFQYQLHALCDTAEGISHDHVGDTFSNISQLTLTVNNLASLSAMETLDQGKARYPVKQTISIPLWYVSDDDDSTVLVGYAVMSQFSCTLKRTRQGEMSMEVNWGPNTHCSHVVVLHDEAIHPTPDNVGDDDDNIDSVTYVFHRDVYGGFNVVNNAGASSFTGIFRIPRDVPFLSTSIGANDVLNATADQAFVGPVVPPVPFQFTKTRHPIDVNAASVARLVKTGLQGLHFSNSRALQRTVFAVAIGKQREDVLKWLAQSDKRYPRQCIPWAVCIPTPIAGTSAKADTKSGDAVLLHMLYSAHSRSGERTVQMPLASRVTIQVKGPAPTSLYTECYIEGYYYRTDAFLSVEEELLGALKHKVVSELQRPKTLSPTCIASVVAAEASKGKLTLHRILLHQPAAARLIAQIMTQMRSLELVGLNTARARDKTALLVAHKTITNGINQLLYHT